MIQPGDALPAGHLSELIPDTGEGCPTGPQRVSVPEAARGRRIVIIGVPGAFTPTCSARHVPGFLDLDAAFRARGVDEIWCLSVNDAYVMAAWGDSMGVNGRIRMLGDGNGAYVRALGLDLDLSARDMGVRSRRFALLAVDGVVEWLHLEEPGKFEVSDAQSVLAALG